MNNVRKIDPSDDPKAAAPLIRTLIVDDHPVIVAGVRALIKSSEDIVCVGDANTAADALSLVDQTEPDVSVVDVSLPDMDGIVLAEHILTRRPGSRVVIMTSHSGRAYVERALQVGARGFVQKGSAGENLLQAIRSVMHGGLYFDPPTAREMTSPVNKEIPSPVPSTTVLGLTAREQDVLRMVALGYSNKEIAARSDISIKSVETYKARATEKLKLHSRAQIVEFALAHGWMKTAQGPID
jgi:DNA-binding NarL/FixJ family response regulator